MPSASVFQSPPEEVLYTTSNGAPYSEPYEAQRVSNGQGIGGPLLLQDFHHIVSGVGYMRVDSCLH